MFSNPFKVRNTVTNDPAVKHIQNKQTTNVVNLYDNVWQCHALLNDKQYATLQRLLSPRTLRYSNRATECDHPVAAELNRFAYEDCIATASRFKNHCIEFGGSPLRTPDWVHMDVLINDVKTDARYVEAAFCQLGQVNIKSDFRSYLTGGHTLCTKGGQNCDKIATYGYMINVYDITMDVIADLFAKHNLLILDCWMFLPTQLVSVFHSDSDVYRCVVDGKFAKFDLYDNSDIYIHDLETWRDYFRVTMIKCRNFTISVEHKISVGTFTKIRFTRVDHLNGYKERRLCISKHTNDVCIPDLFMYANSTVRTGWDFGGKLFKHSLLVGRTFVEKVLNYACGANDQQFTYNNFVAYCMSFKNSVRFEQGNDTEMVYEGINPTSSEWERIKISLFIIAAVERYRRTATISKSFAVLKQNQYLDQTIIGKVIADFKQYVRNRLDDFFSARATKNLFDITFLCHVDVLYPEDLLANIIRRSDVSSNFIRYTRYPQVAAAPSAPPLPQPGATTVIATTNGPSSPLYGGPPGARNLPDKIADKCVHVMPGKSSHRCGPTTYNPPGDGKCAIHCLANIPKFDPNWIKDMPEDWWDVTDVIEACSKLHFNCIIHVDGEFSESYFDNHPRTVCMNISKAHWTLIECSCAKSYYIGDYADINFGPRTIAVNAANKNLTDGGGQALAFANKFPGYSASVSKPIQDIHVMEFKKQAMVLCVAHNFSVDPDYQKVHDTYHKIFTVIQEQAEAKEATVYLPLIGTAIYGTPLCCFKTCLARYLSNRIKLCFYDNKQLAAYNSTGPCKHGGYVPICMDAAPITHINTPVPDRPDWADVVDENVENRMLVKFNDLLKYVIDTWQKHGIKLGRIVELSAAPGHFASAAKQSGLRYTCCYWDGNGSAGHFKWRAKFKPDHVYQDLIKFVKESSFENGNCYLYDNHLQPEIEASLLELVLRTKGCLITKYNYQTAAKINPPNGYACDVFFNEATHNTASETYYCLRPASNIDKPKILDNVTCEAIKIKLLADKPVKKCSCTHDFESMINANVTFDLKDPGAAFDQVITDVKELAIEGQFLKPEPCKFTLPAILGAPGSRKTQSLLKNTCKSCALHISPFKAISDDYRAQGGFSRTYVSCFRSIAGQKYLIIDECFAISSVIIRMYMLKAPDAKIILVGDPYQIAYQNYNGSDESYNIEYTAPYHAYTYRFGQSVADLLSGVIKITSRAPHDTKVEWRTIDQFDPSQFKKNNSYYCFTHETQKYYAEKGKISVVGSVQGLTSDTVHLYCDDYSSLPKQDQFRHVYTAISRVKQHLVMYTDKPSDVILTVLGSPVHDAMSVFDVAPVAQVQHKEVKQETAYHTKMVTADLTMVSQAMVEDVLSKCYLPSNDQYGIVIDYKNDVIPPNLDGQLFKTTLGSVVPKSTTIIGRRLGLRNYQRHYHGRDQKQVVDCFLTRYAKKTLVIKYEILDRCIGGFERWVRLDYIEYMRSKLSNDEVFKYTTDYLIELQKKFPKDEELLQLLQIVSADPSEDNIKEAAAALSKANGKLKLNVKQIIAAILDDRTSKFKDLEIDWYHSYHQIVQFHMKRQPKEIRDDGFDTVLKAGQGISAWSKMLNCIFSGIFRMFDAHFRDILLHNVQIAYGSSDAALSKFFRQYATQINDCNYKKFMADISQFDSSQEQKAILSSAMILKGMGFSHKIIDFYVEKRQSWTLINVASDNQETLSTILRGQWKQHSGQPFTLGGNTMYNMSLIGMCYRFQGLACASFKGDDSYIVAESITTTKIREDAVVDLCGYKVKAFMPPIGEYIANIIMPDGRFFPDVLRRTSRVLSKIITTNADWEEIKISIKDCLDVIEDDEHFRIGCEVASCFYKYFGKNVSPGDVETLVSFLRQVSVSSDIKDLEIKQWRIDTIISSECSSSILN